MEAILSKLIGLLENFYLATYIIAGSAIGIGFTIMDIEFFYSEFWLNLGLCYFAGMIASRLGSIVIEPICKRLNVIPWEPYEKFMKAEQKDTTEKLLNISKLNGTYCTMSAVSIILLIASIVVNIQGHACCCQYFKYPFIYLCITILFLFSYKKQVTYTVKRINHLLANSDNRSDSQTT